MESKLSDRKMPAHHPVVQKFNRSSIVFLTVCSAQRKSIFACEDIHELLKNLWLESDDWLVGRYVIMPDHIHLFCTPNKFPHFSVSKWVHYWKSRASQKWPRFEEQPIWQKSCWDRQLRHGENYHEKWEYVRNNPVRAGLCVNSDDWCFQGELNVLMWHE